MSISKGFKFRVIAATVLSVFVITSIIPARNSFAQETPQLLGLPKPGTMVYLSPTFIPSILKGIKVFPDNPLKFDFILDTGNSRLSVETQDLASLRHESQRLIKYFLTSLTVPDNDMWVNLSPYEKDRIIPDQFGVTEMGRDLLAQDYILKQLTASLIYPENELGKKFWDQVYSKARELYGNTNIPVNTFNKVWVVPDKAVVYENGNIAYIKESHLKVMLEEDYLSSEKHKGDDRSSLGTNIIRNIILPEIEKEVNQGQNFASLRQVYHSMILATWFKRNLKQSLLGKVYVGKNKVNGVQVEDKQIKQKIYQQYLKAFKVGAYNYIKEDINPITHQVLPKKYFSGGFKFGNAMDIAMTTIPLTSEGIVEYAQDSSVGDLMIVSADLQTQVESDHSKAEAVVNTLIEYINQLIEAQSTDKFFNLKLEVWIRLAQKLDDLVLDGLRPFQKSPSHSLTLDDYSYIGVRLNEEWQRHFSESIFPYFAMLIDNFILIPKTFYDFRDRVDALSLGAPLEDRVLSILLRGIQQVMHLRSTGVNHPEFTKDGIPELFDNEDIIQVVRELIPLIHRWKSEHRSTWKKKLPVPEHYKGKRLNITYEDFIDWGLDVMIDTIIHDPQYMAKDQRILGAMKATEQFINQGTWSIDGVMARMFKGLEREGVSEEAAANIIINAVLHVRNKPVFQHLRSPFRVYTKDWKEIFSYLKLHGDPRFKHPSLPVSELFFIMLPYDNLFGPELDRKDYLYRGMIFPRTTYNGGTSPYNRIDKISDEELLKPYSDAFSKLGGHFKRVGWIINDISKSNSLKTDEAMLSRGGQVDKAMLRSFKSPGGIDLNPNKLNLQSQGQGMNSPNFKSLRDFPNDSFDGFSPIILQIIPANLKLFMELSK